ncbi:amino acid transport protein [Secundilactobacillus malefermentans DSM 5705 = KCTC 3548]|nr:amino acid transport protein [Secundilactobacillus malefermentans DSM 5705 = KCTC 3548]
MSSRHLLMISLGGVIGTGLFLSSGYTIHQAGPIGTIIAYLIGALLVYAVMLCLGELSVAMPVTGSFHVYATKLIGPRTGFTVAVLYWLTWTVALGSEFTAAGLIMHQWFQNTPEWIWSALFMIVIFLTNAFRCGSLPKRSSGSLASKWWQLSSLSSSEFLPLPELSRLRVMPMHQVYII